MFVKILLVFVFDDVLEHGSIFHVMTVDDVVAAGKIRLVTVIQKNGTCRAISSFHIFMKVLVVVLSL